MVVIAHHDDVYVKSELCKVLSCHFDLDLPLLAMCKWPEREGCFSNEATKDKKKKGACVKIMVKRQGHRCERCFSVSFESFGCGLVRAKPARRQALACQYSR